MESVPIEIFYHFLGYLNHVELFRIESICKTFQMISRHLNSKMKIFQVKDCIKNFKDFYFVCERSLTMRSIKYCMITIFQLPSFAWDIHGTNPFKFSKMYQGTNYDLDTQINELDQNEVIWFENNYDPDITVTLEENVFINYIFWGTLGTKCLKVNDHIAIISKNCHK